MERMNFKNSPILLSPDRLVFVSFQWRAKYEQYPCEFSLGVLLAKAVLSLNPSHRPTLLICLYLSQLSQDNEDIFSLLGQKTTCTCIMGSGSDFGPLVGGGTGSTNASGPWFALGVDL